MSSLCPRSLMTPARTGLAAGGPSERKSRLAADGTVSGEHLDLSLNLIGSWFTFPPEEQDYCDLQCQDL